jgi:hypothetical protein
MKVPHNDEKKEKKTLLQQFEVKMYFFLKKVPPFKTIYSLMSFQAAQIDELAQKLEEVIKALNHLSTVVEKMKDESSVKISLKKPHVETKPN